MIQLSTRRNVLRSAAALGVATLFGAQASACAAIDPIKRDGKCKMKLSLAAYSFRDLLTAKKGESKSQWTLDEFIDFCAAQGLDGTELTSYYFPKEITPEYLAHLKQKTFLLGLEISGTAVANDFCRPPGEARDKDIAHVKKWSDYAAAMGAPCIRIFSGSTPKGQTEAQARAACVAGIEECCRYSGERGVYLALENHGGLSATAEGLLAIVREVRSPWFAVNLDTGNFHSADPYAELAQVAPYAVNVQVKTEMSPAGSAKQPADLARLVRMLRDVGYRGYVVLEYEGAEDPLSAVPRHLDQLRKLIA
jgi:sugar phosphate isomerase/epimerase